MTVMERTISVLTRTALLGIGLLLLGCVSTKSSTPDLGSGTATPTQAAASTAPTISAPKPTTVASPTALLAASTASSSTPSATTVTPTLPSTGEHPTVVVPTSDPSTWAIYHDPDYSFSFRYPADRWTPARPADDDHLLSLTYHEMAIALRIKVKRFGEDVEMQLYGGAAGDFVPQGTVQFLGEEVERTALVYEDITRRIFYNETRAIPRGDLLFSLALVSNRDFEREPVAVVPEAVQAEADLILETFALDSPSTGAPAPTRTPTTAGPPVVLLYQDGELARADVAGSAVEPLLPVSGVGDAPGTYFTANPPVVSPDGRWLIEHATTGETAAEWRLLDVATGAIAAAGSGQAPLSPTWSPNSRAFAFLRDSVVCVYTLASATEACTPLEHWETAEPLTGLLGAAWSPDGMYIALAQTSEGEECCRVTVWLHALDGSGTSDRGVTGLPAPTNTEEMFAWLDDVRLLLKTAASDALSVLYDPGEGEDIPFPGPVRDVSPDGQHILFGSGEVGGMDGATLYTLPANDVCLQPFIANNNWAWSPDGARLAFLLNCPAATEESWLTMLDAATGAVQWQTALPRPAEAPQPLDRLSWSPDGAYLLLDGQDASAPLSPIWRLAADGSGTLEMSLESGYLLGVVAQWGG